MIQFYNQILATPCYTVIQEDKTRIVSCDFNLDENNFNKVKAQLTKFEAQIENIVNTFRKIDKILKNFEPSTVTTLYSYFNRVKEGQVSERPY